MPTPEEIRGVIDREVDGLALRTTRLDGLVEERIAAMVSEDGSDEMYADQRQQVLEDFFDEAELVELRTRFTSEEVFDELAYTSELRVQLIDAQNLAEIDFVALSAARAANVRAAILAENPELDRQIVVGSLRAVEKGSDDRIRMKVVLTAGDDSG